MPTEAELLADADHLDELAASIGTAVRAVLGAMAAGPVVGTTAFTTLVHRAVEAIADNGASSITEAQAQADVCRDRAAVCRRYTEELAAYEQRRIEYERAVVAWVALPAGPYPQAPDPPSRPAPWVDAGGRR